MFWLLAIGLMNRVFTNGPGDRGSIPGQVIPKTQKMVSNTALLSIQHYMVKIKGKLEQSREWSSGLLYTEVKRREPSGYSQLRLATTYLASQPINS